MVGFGKASVSGAILKAYHGRPPNQTQELVSDLPQSGHQLSLGIEVCAPTMLASQDPLVSDFKVNVYSWLGIRQLSLAMPRHD